MISNDFDPEGGKVVVNTTPVTDPKNGTVVINPDGTYTYTPSKDFVGEDKFEYKICDEGTPKECVTAWVVITVKPDNGKNDTYANDDAVNTDAGKAVSGNVLTNDNDPEGNTQTVKTTPISDVKNGVLKLNSDGTFTYTPNAGFSGTDSFVYEVCDDGNPQACDTATVVITVQSKGEFEIKVPNVITTGETTNSILVIDRAGIEKLSIEIFNRWGNIVYTSDDYQNDWTGKAVGNSRVRAVIAVDEYLPTGTYFYVLKAKLKVGNKTLEQKGWIYVSTK